MKTPLPLLNAGMLLLSAITGFAQPVITAQPTSLWVSLGATAEFKVTATGTPPLTDELRFNDKPIDGAPTSRLAITNVQITHAGQYQVVVGNAVGNTTSQVAVLGVDPTFTKITTGLLVTDLGGPSVSTWGDYDNVGYVDLLVMRYKLGSNRLYHNNRDGTFTSITNDFTTKDVWFGLGWADLDNDGWLDVFTFRENKPAIVYYNNRDGTFSASTLGSLAPWTGPVAMADYNRVGLLDVYLPVIAPGFNTLYRNLGSRAFQRMTAAEVGPIVTASTHGGVSWADYDDDGWMDVYAGSFRTRRSLLYRNDGTGRFLQATNFVTQDTSADALSCAWGDYDNDGRLDLFVAGLSRPSALYRNLRNGDLERGVLDQLPLGNNSASWADYNNDGFLDLFLSIGIANPNELYHNNGDGTFTRVTTGSVVTDRPVSGAVCYSGLWFDYDNDGFLDLYVGTGNDEATVASANFLYRNSGNANGWLKVKLVGTVSNRDGAGGPCPGEVRRPDALAAPRRVGG